MTAFRLDPRAILPAALAIAAASCGKTGPLQPPEPRGPLPAATVEARQIGDHVEVAFTVPAPRGEGPSRALRQTELLRVAYPKGRSAQPEPDAFRVRGEIVASVDAEYAKPGDREVLVDPSLGSLADKGIGWTLLYGIRIRDRNGRPSPIVVAKDITTVAPVAAPRALTAQASADGVQLKWQAPEGVKEPSYNLYRGPSNGTLAERPLNLQPLKSEDDLDTTATPGKVYRYVVRTVAADGPPYRESVSSNVVIVDAADKFAPAAPTGLVAVQEGTSARLLWNPGTESDLDGYHVYRQLAGGEWLAIGGLVRQPSFVDSTLPAGATARYRVTAVDRASPPNESTPSAEVELQTAAEPPPAPGGP